MKRIKPLGIFLLLLSISIPLQAQEKEPPMNETPASQDHTYVIKGVSKKEQTPFELPDAISVLKKRDIDSVIPEDLGHAVESLPGLYLQRTAAGQASPFLRGLTGKQVLFTIDGVRFNNAIFRDGPNQYFAAIDPLFVDRIEVIRGPFSVLYGSDALGGVINLVSRKPRLTDQDISLKPGVIGQISSANAMRRLSLDLPLSSPSFSLYATLSKGDYDNLRAGPAIGSQPFTGFDDISGTTGFTWKFSDDWKLDWRLQHKSFNDVFRTDKNTTIVADPGSLPTDGNGNRVAQDTLRIFPKQEDTFSLLSLHHQGDGVLESLQFDLMYHSINEELNRIPRNSTTQREQFFTDDTFGITATAILDYQEASRFTAGIDLYYDTISSGRDDRDLTTGTKTNNDDGAQLPDGSSYLSFGLYIQDEITFADGLIDLRPGLRFSYFNAQADTSQFDPSLDDVSASFLDVTGAIALTIHPTDWLSPSLSIGRGFRAPNLDDLAASKNTGSGDEIPNPELDPEELIGAQLGTKVFIENNMPKSSAPYRFQADAYYFEHWMTDAIVKRNTTFNGNDVVQLQNTGRARIWGWEASMRYYVGPELELFGANPNYILSPNDSLLLWANASYTHGDDLSAKVPFARIPPIRINLGSRYQFPNTDIFIEPSIEIWTRQDRRNPSKDGDVRFAKPFTPGFTLYHLNAGWNMSKHATLSLALRNITDKNYQVLGSGVFGPGTDIRAALELRW